MNYIVAQRAVHAPYYGPSVASLVRQSRNSSEMIFELSDSSVRNTSMTLEFSCLLIRQTPSPVIVSFKKSRKEAAKLIQRLPSHVPFPVLLTVPGMDAVSISSSRCRIPFRLLKPTIIFGTPRRKDLSKSN